MSKRTLNVTQRDIDRAKKLIRENRLPRNMCCPIALAAQRSFKDKNAAVGYSYLYPHAGMQIKSPDEIRSFVRTFDDGKKVEPTKFVIEVPE